MYGLISLLNRYDALNRNETLTSRSLCPSETQRISGCWSLYNFRAYHQERKIEKKHNKKHNKEHC